MLVNNLQFDIKGDERGALIALESPLIPFEIKRVYYIFGTSRDVVRGLHAHRQLEQVAVCVAGSCKFILDDGHQKKEVVLDAPDKGLYISRNIWREMREFSQNCVLMVLASQQYDPNDYIWDYQEFLREVQTK